MPDDRDDEPRKRKGRGFADLADLTGNGGGSQPFETDPNVIPIKPAPAYALPEFSASAAAIDDFVTRCSADSCLPFDRKPAAWLTELRQRNPAAFEGLRARLKKETSVRVAALDKALDEVLAQNKQRERSERKAGPTQANRLIELTQAASLFHTPDDVAYADIIINGHRETWAIRSKTFRQWLGREFFTATEGAPNSDAMAAALNVIEARAHFEAPTRRVHLRVAGLDGKIYLDLADEQWRAVEIDARGWRIITDVPVRFRRPRGMLAIPDPIPGGSLATLHGFLNVKHQTDLDLVDADLQAALRDGPNHPVLGFGGEHGAAKTFACRILRTVIDPNTLPTRSPPRDLRDLFIMATNNYVLPFDNLRPCRNGCRMHWRGSPAAPAGAPASCTPI
jgi:hypothetical protein